MNQEQASGKVVVRARVVIPSRQNQSGSYLTSVYFPSMIGLKLRIKFNEKLNVLGKITQGLKQESLMDEMCIFPSSYV